MKIRTIIITAVLTLSMVAGMAGCAGGNGSVSDTSSVSQVSQENGSGYSDDNDTKVLQMLDKVTLNGKPMKIPYKQSDLPEGFSFDDDVSVYEKDGNTYAYGTLLLNGKKVSSMNISNYKENITPDKIVASSLDYTFLKEDYAGLVEIDGISGKSKRGEILSKFGEPSRIETFDDGSGVLYYGMDSNDNTYIDFWYNEDSIINTISIVNEI
ncbi:hypothetical protein [Ruminococcus sp.]